MSSMRDLPFFCFFFSPFFMCFIRPSGHLISRLSPYKYCIPNKSCPYFTDVWGLIFWHTQIWNLRKLAICEHQIEKPRPSSTLTNPVPGRHKNAEFDIEEGRTSAIFSIQTTVNLSVTQIENLSVYYPKQGSKWILQYVQELLYRTLLYKMGHYFL